MNKRKALIIGCGVAGPVVAMFFKRAGIEAEIYEARPTSDGNEGSFLNMAGNGLSVLGLLGLDAVVAAAGSPTPRMIMWSGKGKRLGEVRNGGRASLTESVTIKRPILNTILREAAEREGIKICYGKKLRSIENSAGGGVIASFEDGTTASGDFLVGCDGVHSRTRHIINPDAPKPTYTDLVSTGSFTYKPALAPTPDTQHFFFGKRAFFGYHVRSSGEIYWFNNYPMPQEPGRSELNGIVSADWKQKLLEQHRDDLPLIRDIIQSTEADIIGYPIYDIPVQPVWHKGSVVLIGDAVHAVSPSSGQGASLAMEDAAVLAKCLQDYSSLEEAFAAYEALRRERVEKMVKWARSLGDRKAMSNPIQQLVEKVAASEYLQSSFVQTSEENDAWFQIKAVQDATCFA